MPSIYFTQLFIHWQSYFLNEGEMSMVIMIGEHFLVFKELMWHARCSKSHCFSSGCISCYCPVSEVISCILLRYSPTITWSLVESKLLSVT